MEYRREKRPRARGNRPMLAGAAPLQQECWVVCPYCGETFVLLVDVSAGDQSYYEDCEVCCRPILFRIATDGGGNVVGIIPQREDD